MHVPTHKLKYKYPLCNPLYCDCEWREMGMKGHPQSNCGGGGGDGISSGWVMKKKKKVAMLAVVILVVAVIGVMMVQKVRDRRMFKLVIKDKDRQIISLHLLLQKERQYAKENKRKNQHLNAKLYSLGTQKNELDNKIMEMQSTIGSIKDEQRALEIAIQEKQNEIKDLKSKSNNTTTNRSNVEKLATLKENGINTTQVANREEGVTQFKPKNYSTEALHRAADTKPTYTNSSTNASEVDHDYKEETED